MCRYLDIRRGSPWRTLRAQGPLPVIRALVVCGPHMCGPYGASPSVLAKHHANTERLRVTSGIKKGKKAMINTVVGAIVVSVSLVVPGVVAHATETDIMYLSGTDKDQTVEWNFKVVGGRNAGGWSKIPVPSNWETQGYGTYQYWADWRPANNEGGSLAPDRQGHYRYNFTVPQAWRSKRVRIVFDAVMTETTVLVNRKLAGEPHIGGFYRFSYDISDLLNFDGAENVLEAIVNRYTSSNSTNKAEREGDYWTFSGIYRPVWLEAYPQTYISRIAINAKHGGLVKLEATVEDATAGDTVVAQVQTLDGAPVGGAFQAALTAGDSVASLEATRSNIDKWTAETPNLYQLHVAIRRPAGTVHEINERFGFRTVEVRAGNGVYINGKKIRIRGVNRASFWPTTGRTTSRLLSVADVNLMKDMNMNAVRMAHYPPDKHFLEAADELGLYVLDELAGWQASYGTSTAERLVKQMVVRDHNHPSIIFWANGNEGGWNTAADNDFGIWDTQDRTVLHPWTTFGNINTDHYEGYDSFKNLYNRSTLVMPTEFLHGLFDGGLGAGLEDHWNLMLSKSKAVGGFLWVFADEGLVRDDWNGAIDVDGNRAPDGILGPFREKEGSFFTIKEIWSPFHVTQSNSQWLPDNFNGAFAVENRYDFTNLNTHTIQWELLRMPGPGDNTGETVGASGSLTGPNLAPTEAGSLNIGLPDGWQANYDAMRLRVNDGTGREIYTYSWPLKRPVAIAGRTMAGASSTTITQTHANNVITWTQGTRTIKIGKQTGELISVMNGQQNFQLSNGPRVVGGTRLNGTVTLGTEGGRTAAFTYPNGSHLRQLSWKLMSNGWLKLGYTQQEAAGDKYNIGAMFDFPGHDTRIARVDWLGNGPYRVWKNRLRGVEYGLWGKEYNNTITGHSWVYPEFKGFHSHLNWAVIDVKDAGPITVVTENDDLYLLLLKPVTPQTSRGGARTAKVTYPAGDIGFLHQIAAKGSKFKTAADHGPAGKKYRIPSGGESFQTTLYFYFGTLP